MGVVDPNAVLEQRIHLVGLTGRRVDPGQRPIDALGQRVLTTLADIPTCTVFDQIQPNTIDLHIDRRSIDDDLEVLDRLITSAPDSDPLLRLAALLRSSSNPKSALAAAAAWRFSNPEIARLERLTREPLLSLPLPPGESRKKIYRLGKETYLDLLKLSAKTREDVQSALPVPDVPFFPLTGQDLIDRQVQPGPRLGELLELLEDWWLDYDMQPDREACLQELDRRLRNARNP